jgi:Fic family protein
MRAAGYATNETDTFADKAAITFGPRETSPHVNRMRLMWARMREDVLKTFPAPPGLPKDTTAYLKKVDDLYVNDAYNSLSIEGYRISAELIDRVRTGNWHPETNDDDRENHNALAARGYWQAFQAVKQTVGRVLAGENAGTATSSDYARWYTELFAPGVTAGIFRPAELAGFRTGPVFVRLSMHVPPSPQAVRDLMPAFFELLEQEREPSVRAVLGHFVFVYIHPYFDGNGRLGRFLMNTMMASGGYPWTIAPLERRTEYMAALESASVEQDIRPFTKLLATLVQQR